MAITINGSGTVTGLSVGGLPDGTVDSGTLATDSVTAVKIPDTVESSLKSGRKNLIINGGFDVWQRGASFSGLSPYSYFADRWQCGISTTCSRSTDTPTDEGFNYSAKLEAGSGGNILRMMLEDSYRLLGSNSFTFSFWIKGSVASTGGMDVGDQQVKSFSITTSWTKITQNFTEISTTAHGGSSNDYFDITSSVAGDFYITGVQLELGSVATDFEHRSYGEELALCQRYYYRINNTGYTPAVAVVVRWDNTSWYGVIDFPTTMRTKPTGSRSSATALRLFEAGVTRDTTSITLPVNESTETQSEITVVVSGFTGRSGWLRFLGSGTGWLAWSAEL